MKTILGLDVIRRDNFEILKGKRVGLITNYSGVSSDLKINMELMLKDGIKVKKYLLQSMDFLEWPMACP